MPRAIVSRKAMKIIRDMRTRPAPIGAHSDNVRLLQPRTNLRILQHSHIVDLAGQAPRGSDVHHVIPGTAADGSIDGAKLEAWVKEARKLAHAVGRGAIADQKIGEMLSASQILAYRSGTRRDRCNPHPRSGNGRLDREVKPPRGDNASLR